ncbi:MAG: endonuclease/exonuclease/phosphatase family protein [Clostridia bacterium]|nr:endonuclease/exonuclease/phosphatase family protein [Clostridia bacterium]
MKRLIATVLCLVMFFSVMVTATVAETAFTSSTNTTTPLFLISGANMAGQEFVPGSEVLEGIKVYLANESANNTIDVTVYSGTPDTGTQIYTETLTLVDAKTDWFELLFSTAVAVTAGERYSFSVHTANRAVWNGMTTVTGYSCTAWNNDGGWKRFGDTVAAFELIGAAADTRPAYEILSEKIAALPAVEEITLADQERVMGLYNEYVAMNSSDRGKVVDIQKLIYCKNRIEDLIYREEHKERFDIEDAITALGTITTDSRDALVKIDQMLYHYVFATGVNDVENYQTYVDAVKAFNALDNVSEKPLYGDPDGDNAISAADALMILKQVVGKVAMTDQQKELADVDDDGNISAADALLVLQHVVGKIDKFPADKETADDPIEPVTHELPLYSVKGQSLYAETYQSMLDRTHENGYAQTSLNGAYVGMFGRDSSIQVMAHIAQGDYDYAAKILKYIVDYHKEYKKDYVLHIMQENKKPYSDKLQTDTTFFFLHAWYMYATKAPASAEKTALLNASEDKVKDFADYFIDDMYFNREKGLMENPYLEHSRDKREWNSYDLLTNVYASQAWYELSKYFATKDPARAKAWREGADLIAQGVHKHLVTEIDGKKMYAELIDIENDKFVQGFSWVNMAPVGCEWYAMDEEIMANTYELYMKYGAGSWFGKYKMLEVHTNYTGSTNVRAREIIGKGLAWELMYCKMVGNTDRIRTLEAFIEKYSDQMYRETWQASGGGSDAANQEHASWMLFAHKYCHPELTKKDPNAQPPVEEVNGLRVATFNIHILSDASAATIAKDITDAGLDIVGLQEVDNNTIRTGKKDQAKLLADELGWYYGYSKAIDLEGGAYGHAIISKYPIKSYSTFQLPSGTEEQRVCGHAVIQVGTQMVNFFNTHTTWTSLQSGQFQEIADRLSGLDNFIITGDFNCSNFAAFNVFGGNIVNNATNTFVTNGEDGAIDNIVVCKKWTVGKGTMVNNGHSDHNMLYADITF